jgi:hypothetical protein
VEINPKYSQNGNEYLSIQLHIRDKKGKKNRRIGLFGQRVRTKRKAKSFVKFIKFSVAIVASNGSLVNGFSSEFLDKDLFNEGFGWKQFIARRDLFNPVNHYMSGNTFMIRCRIESSDENDCSSHKRIAQSFEKCYSSLFNDKVLSDFTIEVKGKQFAVHKTVLAARSSVFRDMFCNVGNDEKSDDKIVLQNIEREVFEEMLTFIYTGKAPNVKKYANELLIAADFYDIRDLRTICGQILFKEITDKNVMKALEFAQNFGLQELEMRAIKFIANNSDKVAKHALKKY